MQLYRMLPGTNCKKCGEATCFAFAFSLISRDKKPEDCPDLLTDKFKTTMDFLHEHLGGEAEVQKTGLLIDKEKCIGCGDCVITCQKCQGAIMFGSGVIIPRDVPQVLQIIDGTVQVVNWNSCKRCMSTPEYCRVCEERCPTGALEMVK